MLVLDFDGCLIIYTPEIKCFLGFFFSFKFNTVMFSPFFSYKLIQFYFHFLCVKGIHSGLLIEIMECMKLTNLG